MPDHTSSGASPTHGASPGSAGKRRNGRAGASKPVIVGILNVTPDSFSDGGNFLSPSQALARVEQLLIEGADVVEIGGESVRPGAVPVDADVEARRVLPVVREVVRRYPEVRIAVDTVKAGVARMAVAAGATIVNDVSALRIDPALADVCAEGNCTLVLMHSRGTVSDMAQYAHATYGDVMTELIRELRDAVERALSAGVPREAIVLDPGLGFSKTPRQSVQTLARLPELVELGFPVMIGASRKRFIGEITGARQAGARDAGTIGANVAALTLGATWFRVHDVLAHRHALDVAHAILSATGAEPDPPAPLATPAGAGPGSCV